MTKNDWKYVLRRVITYIAIAMIMFFISSCKAQAIVSVPLQQPTNQCSTLNGACYFTYNNVFYNGGKGTIYFSTFVTSGNPTTVPVVDATVEYTDSTATGCRVGDIQSYNDNLHSNILQTIECPVDLTGKGVKRIYLDNKNQGSNPMYYSYRMTFVEETAVNMTGVIAAINNNNYTSLLTNIYNDLSAFKTRTNEQLVDLYYLIQQQGQDLNTINNSVNNVNNSVQEVNDSINDSTPPSSSEISGSASDWNSNNAENGVINQLVLMPITLLNSFVNGINGSCSPYDFGELWGEHIIFPCIDLSKTLGSVWTIIDVILSGMFIFIFGKRCVKIFNDFTNLRSGQIDTLYGGDN